MRKRRKIIFKRLIFVIALFLFLIIGLFAFIYISTNKTSSYYVASNDKSLTVYDDEGNSLDLVRGSSVDIKKKRKTIDDVEYCQLVHDKEVYYILETNLKEDRQDTVLETNMYTLRSHVLTDEYDGYKIVGNLKKNELVNITGYHNLLEDGRVDYYYVNDTGYIKSDYLALEFYETGLDASIYSDCFYGEGGDPTKIEYYPKEELHFSNNVMPEVVKSLYINAEAVCNASSYIDIAQRCGINAFVVDIKDCYVDTQLAYDSPTALKYAPSTENIPNTFEEYKENLKKLKDAGFYLIGRITAFKDDSFAIDNPDEAYMYEGRLYNYGYVKWPSVYSRKMWEYNVALALEAVNEFGFNEIQFDYCRLPEDVEDVDLRNKYDEDRCQAICSFLRYATEILHNHEVYVAADVFGETSGDSSEYFSAWPTSYGQFWPAMSNVVDVISSMPYPDHFSSYAYDIPEPWYNPYDLMYAWGKATYYAQENTYDKAKCRTWIEAQSPDLYDVTYDVYSIIDQIDGLKDANVFDGYMTWSASSSIERYEAYIEAFN